VPQRELPGIGVLTISLPSASEALRHRKIALNRLAQTGRLFSGKRENGNTPHWKRDGSQPRSTASRKLHAGVVSVR
jgi:hypothetical protein